MVRAASGRGESLGARQPRRGSPRAPRLKVVSTGRKCPGHVLVGVDEVFLTGRRLAVNRYRLEVERLEERDFTGITAGEGGLELCGHPRLEFLSPLRTNLL